MERKKAYEFDPEVLDLFDQYVHGGISRRQFLEKAARFAVGGMTASALLEALSPNYAWAQQVPADDPRLKSEYIHYPSPQGHERVKALLARPAGAEGKLPGVVVVHENRGLNPYIEDVARRLAVEGYLALAPDGLTPLGGYPGTDDEGRSLQRQLDRAKLVNDFEAAAVYLKAQPDCTGKVGVVGFCFGGMVANALAVRLPDLAAAVPFYGRQPAAEDVAKIRSPLLIHYGGNDRRVNEGWPAYEEALKAHDVDYTVHFYEGANHGFHNDTTPRYDADAAQLAWNRTLEFFARHLRSGSE